MSRVNSVLELTDFAFFFFCQVFFHRHWRFSGQQGKRGDHLLFHSTTSTRSRILRHLFATLHVRWLSLIFNRNACVYQAATPWDLPPSRITIWLIIWWCNICLSTWWIDSRFRYSDLTLETGEFELAWTITLVLQANRLTKCASHPICQSWQMSETGEKRNLPVTELSGGNCLGVGNYPAGNYLGGNCPGDNCPGGIVLFPKKS